MKVGSLCTGYGGIELGLQLAGVDIDVAWRAEVDPILEWTWGPYTEAPNLGDITHVDWSNPSIEPVDLLTAGFPCQPTSSAGLGLGERDPRWLWPAILDCVANLLPYRILLENVRNLVSYDSGELWAGILKDLSGFGYDVRWVTLGACTVGAAHHRHRVFALATHKQHRVGPSTIQRIAAPECAGQGMTLLPTPSTSNSHGNKVNNRGEQLLPGAVQPEHWGKFAGAVARHAARYGPPPAPTEPNRNGSPRLAPAFAEWLMCIPAGHVTDALPRSAALKAIGNGVCPPQLAQAWRYLTGVDKPSDMSIGFGAMTTSTSADVKEIQDRNAAARGRVIAAGFKAEGTDARGVDDAHMAEIIEAAMMELAAVWREEAAHVTAAGRKGHVGIAKEYTMAAARLAGFAVGLTSRPVDRSAAFAAGDHAAFDDMAPSPPCDDGVHPEIALSLRRDGSTVCTACQTVLHAAPSQAEAVEFEEAWGVSVVDLAAALPDGDPVAAVFSSTTLTGDEPVGTKVTVAGIEFTKIGTDPFGSEENALRDIIGPLGASNVTATIDHPFTNPGIPWLNQRRSVEVIPYAELPIIAAATPPRGHVSHSYVETYEGCSLAAMLRDASRAGHVGASRPAWSQLGGQAFHSAVEQIERLAVSGVTFVGPDETLWNQHFDVVIKEQLDALVGTPYADSATWYISNRGKEGFDWWRVEGAKMLGLYVKHHTSAWRANNPTFLLQDTTPVIEMEYSMSIRSLDGERGLTAQGFVDRATLDLTTYSLTVLDYKTGSREPESTFQLGEYGHALLMAMGIAAEPADRPILGRYWLARKGIYTDAVPVVTRHPLAELQYRYDAAARGTQARIFAPHVTALCKSCSVVDYCPAQAGRS